MKKKKYPKYIEWFSPLEMHENSRSWISQLAFIQHEQEFLNGLITYYMRQLADTRLYKRSKEIIQDLLKNEGEITSLHEKVIKHESQLDIMLDDVDQPKMEQAYRDEHHDLIQEMEAYEIEYQKTKKLLFALISEIIKKEKQHHLLN